MDSCNTGISSPQDEYLSWLGEIDTGGLDAPNLLPHSNPIDPNLQPLETHPQMDVTSIIPVENGNLEPRHIPVP
ncbi:hypothetical protein EJB05_00861, partial [Eragrostis curvula]